MNGKLQEVLLSLEKQHPYLKIEWFNYYNIWECAVYVRRPKLFIAAIGQGATIDEAIEQMVETFLTEHPFNDKIYNNKELQS